MKKQEIFQAVVRLHGCKTEKKKKSQPTWAVEYTDNLSATGLDPPSTTSVLNYDARQSDGEAPVMLWGMRSTP